VRQLVIEDWRREGADIEIGALLAAGV